VDKVQKEEGKNPTILNRCSRNAGKLRGWM
jgi:hypothetical protein